MLKCKSTLCELKIFKHPKTVAIKLKIEKVIPKNKSVAGGNILTTLLFFSSGFYLFLFS